ncbi:MAG: hypothetical protein A2289_21500 [Deltaproteobacteria bacterium RIFOXYA12_FULL_58_15]|nr:MAG: hypothetical protein A2289_21500 [Deltaproteobacteria bacterium RIFOXYA12_FULL_58_15]OGR11881.1 MAG: hypothetical protein A2341_17080 [Deltaproteobacteria bacterium RIFOXYB12_FULL_58_9]
MKVTLGVANAHHVVGWHKPTWHRIHLLPVAAFSQAVGSAERVLASSQTESQSSKARANQAIAPIFLF